MTWYHLIQNTFSTHGNDRSHARDTRPPIASTNSKDLATIYHHDPTMESGEWEEGQLRLLYKPQASFFFLIEEALDLLR